MDNKITKSRLSNFLSYEWIVIVVVIALVIVGWEFLYSVTAVRLNFGQQFYYIYDLNVYAENRVNLKKVMTEQKVFSFDVLEIKYETLMTSTNSNVDLLSVRSASEEGDVIITESFPEEEQNGYVPCRAKRLIDGEYNIRDIDYYYNSAITYLSLFLKEGETNPLKFENLNPEKIEDRFYSRLKGDNRLRYNQISSKDEIDRISKLCQVVSDLKKLLEYDDAQTEENKIFYSYVRYEQSSNIADEIFREDYKTLYEEEKLLGAKRYGLKIDKLPTVSTKMNTADYFRAVGKSTSENTLILIFDYLDDGFDYSKNYKGDLQFEKISFLVNVVKNFSTILD